MAKTALLAQNDNLTIKETKTNVGRSVFDLSHSTTFPIDIDGAILPICSIETVPSDSFEISCECLLRQLSPLKVPLMTNIRLNTAFYWCDNRLAWKKWDRFIQGGRSGNEVYDIPRVANSFFVDNTNTKYNLVDVSHTTSKSGLQGININYKNSLHTYFNICLNQKFDNTITFETYNDMSEELPIAFPEFDYQLICRDYYTDIDRLADNPASTNAEKMDFSKPFSDWAYSNLFPPDDDEIKLKDGIQTSSGFQSGDDSVNVFHGFVLDKVRYHNVRDDYFTSSKKAPMRGTPPTISLATSVGKLDFSKSVNTILEQNQSGLGVGVQRLGTVQEPDDKLMAGIIHESAGTPGEYYVSKDNDYSNYLLNALNKGEADVEVTSQITASELLLLSQLSQWQILNMLAEPKYDDFLNVHFNGVKVGEAAVEKPIYIGGTSQIIHINEILQQSASDQTSFLGSQGATLHSLENNYVGKFFCNSYGWIIGVCYLQADLLYNPAIPRGFSRRTKEDFYFPEFANLSMQAILNKEIFFSNDSDWNNTPWGYTGCFDELRSIPNHVAGDCLNESYQDLQAWTLRRNFTNDNKPSMSSEFLSEKGNIDYTAWQVPSMPKFMLQCANYIKAVRPMPYVAIPKAL